VHALTVLLSSTDPSLVDAVEGVVGSLDDLRLETCAPPDEVCRRTARGEVGLVLLHAAGSLDVSALVGQLKTTRRKTLVMILSDRDDPEQELALFRLGVADYFARPLDLNRLSLAIDSHTIDARVALNSEREADLAVEYLGDGDSFLYAPGAEMGRLMEQVRRIAPLNATVLLGGETGTGKTRLARLIHELSQRRSDPFFTVNCGSLSESLIESEMFGHVRGAFTGADRDRVGKFAEAGRGTILLDDIDALPLALQGKLLRVVDERVFEAVGNNRPQPLEARLIAASNRRLEGEVAAGRFRADLFYRLNVVGFYLPPLRDRAHLIPHLARKFAADFAAAAGRPMPEMAPEALIALDGHPWPGNVRELRNVIERAVALCPEDTIGLDDLPDAMRTVASVEVSAPRIAPGTSAAATLARSKEEAEKVCIAEALQRHSNNRLRAAAELGISRMTLYKKLHKYGLMQMA
jgi:two-component system, NtrC family, response regulator HydG